MPRKKAPYARAVTAIIVLASIAVPGPEAARAADVDDVTVGFDLVASGLDYPTGVAAPDDGSGRVFIVEKSGRVRVWRSGTGVRDTPFLSITGRVNSGGYEQGMLGLAFHPNFDANGRFYVTYTDGQGDLRIARFRIADPSGNDAPESSERIILQVTHRQNDNHNGGDVHFGSRYLFVSTGDGGGGGDEGGYAQNKGSLKGKILRIDVDRSCGDRRYCIPGSNPFFGSTPGRGEVWHYGLRNPWRWSFDPATGRMYIGDVGQSAREEVDVAADGARGINFGWDCREGTLDTEALYGGAYCTGGSFRGPVAQYDHSGGRCAIIGGAVYRGDTSPALRGIFVYADNCSNEVWGLKRRANGTWDTARIGVSPGSITGFGQRPNGEVFAVTSDGRMWRVTGTAA
jgi:glucose/arabinose dehydrogenase